MGWADEMRRLKVRANADVPRDAKQARKFGAEGIGLCRTEHMFFAEDRLAHVVQMIMNAAEAKTLEARFQAKSAALEEGPDPATAKALRKELAALKKQMAGPVKAYKQAIAKLLPMQRADFRGLFQAMDGFPVTIRTLDPPLHEFLPKREELMVEVALLNAEWERAKKRSRSRASRPGSARPKRSCSASRSCTSSIPCSDTAAAGWASRIPRSPRCRRARSSRPRARSPRRAAR